MATPTQIVTRALRRLNVIPLGGTPSGEDVAEGTEALTAMINSWEGMSLSGDVLPLDARFEQGVVAMLAVRLAEEYGKVPSPLLLRDAEDGMDSIRAAFMPVGEAVFDYGLVGTSRRLQAETPDIFPAWQPSTAYLLRRYVRNGANLYECVTAGTSAASGGPSGTDAEITDGTVTWCWRRVAGEPEIE